MIYKINRKKRTLIVVIAIITALIPILITFFELITSEKESVVFLENYPTSISTLVLLYYLFLIILGVFWFTKQIISLIKLKNEKAKTELLHLKSQVNPHFFFNTLNNIYGLVGTDAKKAQKLILKLSDMMRYSIYEGEKDMVRLKEEVNYLKNYIELHQMRYHKSIDVKFTIDIHENHKVLPLLFIILLENAFKHGISYQESSYIDISMSQESSQLSFTIRNSNPAVKKEEGPSGIGIENSRKRLDLLYGSSYTLDIDETKDTFTVSLNIPV